MSIIGVKGIPGTWGLIRAEKFLAKVIKGPFEGLNFKESKGNAQRKTFYLRLSEKLDPVRVLEKVNTTRFPKTVPLTAFIPDHIPDIPLADLSMKRIPLKVKKATKYSEVKPDRLMELMIKELMIELQLKYPALHELNNKYKGIPIDTARMIVMERLSELAEKYPNTFVSYFALSKSYRRSHSHSTDYQLVLTVIHKAQTAVGAPQEDFPEKDLTLHSLRPILINNFPMDQVQQACTKYSETMIQAVTEHIDSLKSETSSVDNEEEIAKKKVREELKKMAPFLPQFFKEVISRNFLPDQSTILRMRVYGEPYLPPHTVLEQFLHRYHALQIIRAIKLHYMTFFKIPLNHYASIMAMDGTVLNGAKLIIRCQDLPFISSWDDSPKNNEVAADGTGEDVTMKDEIQSFDDKTEEDEWTEAWE